MLAPGTRLGVYEVVAAIGAGGMGEKVYRAREEPVRPTIEADARRLLDSRSFPVTAERLISRRTVLGLLGASALVHAAGCGTSSPASQFGAGPAEPLHYLTLREIGRRIESRDLSPLDLAERMLDRIATVDRSLKSYATVMRVEALAAARAADQEIRAGNSAGRCTVWRWR